MMQLTSRMRRTQSTGRTLRLAAEELAAAKLAVQEAIEQACCKIRNTLQNIIAISHAWHVWSQVYPFRCGQRIPRQALL